MRDFDFLVSWLSKEFNREKIIVPQVMYRRKKEAS